MHKYLIACLLPVLAVVVISATPKNKTAILDRITPVQRSLKLYEMEQKQIELDRAVQQFRTNE